MAPGFSKFKIGDKVRPEPGQTWAFGKDFPKRTFWDWLFRRPKPVYTVVSSRYQEPRCQIGGTYTTIEGHDGEQYELPDCFIVKAA